MLKSDICIVMLIIWCNIVVCLIKIYHKMKTIDKQNFAKLMLTIYSDFLRSYHYDSFYDLKRLRTLEENNKEVKLHLYFRRSGSDILYNSEFNVDEENTNLHKTYMQRNNLVLYLTYIPQIDHNSDLYNIEIIKDQYDFLMWNDILKEN